MIITCPDCATRYDVDDERFSPSGRSVRCSSCGESWFVPAPELLDMEPLDDDKPRKKAAREDKDERSAGEPRRDKRVKVGLAEEEEPRKGRKSRKEREDTSFDDEEDDDSLFDSPSSKKHDARDFDDDDARPHRKKFEEDDDPAPKGWRKGRQFIVEEDEDESERRPFFARRRKHKEEDEKDRASKRESLRFADEEDGDRSDLASDADEDDRDYRDEEEFIDVVDADWEDVEEEDGERQRGFGRRIRAGRRRATALARMEDVRPIDPDDLDDEFFAALRVTPRELERAIRKARRRAESREKNRLTPLRVFGWTAWIAVVAGLSYGIVAYREDIVKMAPKAADAYAVIGIEANPYGLSIEDVRHRLAISTAGPTIEITGNLRNESDEMVVAPLLQAEALGPRGELLARWTFTALENEVATGASIDFMTRVPAPEGVTEVALSFAPSRSVLDSLLSPDD
ncbi:zinc-ribbon domain-containing protein [Hyphococcus flavus]|uniref:Zinc-ribbon domain-containing protein n=1 Tax=Hyphococcus flavus TaxID=1866326 RepID=A0AAE9ZLR2_9PROT|nr:zinc-ribbon domain-containing protein [Hyphococcus flavus]WDI33060.1 zinc-ribbon domain-containing protein [Hyphococcus flavus]